jgi:hypothetical protein
VRLHEAGEVAWLNDAREWLANTTMSRYDLDAVEDDDLIVAEQNLDGPVHEAVRHAVANRLDVDEGVRRDAPRQALLANRQRPRGHGRSDCRSSRSKRSRGRSFVVPWIRESAAVIHVARWASSAAKLSKLRPAMAFRFT